MVSSVLLLKALVLFVCLLASCVEGENEQKKIDAVICTTGKDTRAFERSIVSALKHLVDVDKYYIITPSAKDVEEKLTKALELGPRVVFVDESIFPFDWRNVSEVMIESVRERGVYPLNDKSQFEHTVWGRVGWFLQQLLKLYAGKYLNLNDFVLLDSDIVWFKDINFINDTSGAVTRYNYACSGQYHPAYVATLKRVSGVDLYKNPDIHRSGISHHIVIVKSVLEDLMNQTEARYGGLDFWRVLLNESAIELTCRAPRAGICGGGSTLSEYELYFNYARMKFPETVSLRPLMWSNGPMPGLLFWPPLEEPEIQPDGRKANWLGHRQVEVPAVLEKQMRADELAGYDYAAYHGYARRRYFELIDPDIDMLCKHRGVPDPINGTTCSWRGFEERKDGPLKDVTEEIWFQHCACYMANHQSGP